MGPGLCPRAPHPLVGFRVGVGRRWEGKDGAWVWDGVGVGRKGAEIGLGRGWDGKGGRKGWGGKGGDRQIDVGLVRGARRAWAWLGWEGGETLKGNL